MDRRNFLKTATAVTALGCTGNWQQALAQGQTTPQVGEKWIGWKPGQFQVHFIYTGVAESMFYIFPDGTTMLLDCGDHDALARGEKAVVALPNTQRHAGEWIARYVQRVNPAFKDVDYLMLSHYHDDHAGCPWFYADKVERDGKPYYISGLSQAAEFLNFGKAFDRCWPTYDDPLPFAPKHQRQMQFVRNFYEYQQKNRGMKMEKFQLGAVNQIAMLHNASQYPKFSIRNICANGRIANPDGTIKDLYAERIARDHLTSLNENGMSLGMVFTYGKFKFFTAGDFSDSWKLPDGTKFQTENELAKVCGHAHVAKINHHGHYSMPDDLIKALGSRVYVSCVWDQLHTLACVMERIADRKLYPGDRTFYPGIMPVERRRVEAGQAWLKDVEPACFEGVHIILNVEENGEDYSMTCLSAADEKMLVKSVNHYKV